MNDLEFKGQLARYDDFIGVMKTPAQVKKGRRHPDIGRESEKVAVAHESAQTAIGSEDPLRYEEALVALRRAVGSWRTVDGGYGPVA